MFLGFRKLLRGCTEGTCHSTIYPGMSLHVISFTRPFPALVLQVTNTGAKRPGYEASGPLEGSGMDLIVIYTCIVVVGSYNSLPSAWQGFHHRVGRLYM